jgi:hypothetical protein
MEKKICRFADLTLGNKKNTSVKIKCGQPVTVMRILKKLVLMLLNGLDTLA